jgi:hypothetical protein
MSEAENSSPSKATDLSASTTDWRAVALPALLSLVGAFSGSALSAWSASVAAQNEYSEKFSQLVNATLPHLKNESEAGMAFAGLYSLAKGESQKRAVIAIASNSSSSHVRATLAALIGADPMAKRIVNESSTRALILAGADELIETHRKHSGAVFQHPDDLFVYPDYATAALLRELAPPAEGWVAAPAVIASIDPKTNEPKSFRVWRDCYVWDSAPSVDPQAPQGLLSHIVGVYKKDTTLVVVDSGTAVIYWQHVGLQ